MDIMQQAQYQKWAEQKLFEVLKKLPEQNFVNHIPGFTRSLQEIYIHKYELCFVWYYSMLAPKNVATTPDFQSMSKNDLIAEALNFFDTIINYIKNNSSRQLKLEVEGLKKTLDTTSDEILFNIFNHLTYHRGQTALKLKKFGFEIPDTEYASFLYETKKLL